MQSSVVHLGFKLEKLGFSTLWTALAGTAVAVVYMFTTFASAADVKEVKDQVTSIEVRLIKADIRELRAYIRTHPNEQRAKDDLAELIDDLCQLKPDDRECR